VSRTGEHVQRWGALCLALLCLVAWLGTALHLAVEPHDHDHVAIIDDHDDDHHHDDDHEHPAGESHDADDHLIAATSRPAPALATLSALVPPSTLVVLEPRTVTPARVPPRDDAALIGDPPPPARPRAPPVG
jgi:hypothetical protein